MKAFVIAAPHSGSGKTTITLGIMEVLRRSGLTVAPFKVGPDFIDPGYHRLVTRRPSINLDGWVCGRSGVLESFFRHAKGADVAVIEGVMGLFDGFGGVSAVGSSAQVAELLNAPVILVVDARGQARSVAALLKGFTEFDPDITIAGIIFNQVSSDSHADILAEAVATLDSPPAILGCIPADNRLAIPSRHLGLVTAEDNPLSATYLDYLAATIREHVDMAALWAIAQVRPDDHPLPLPEPAETDIPAVKIAVARDEAFCFVYEENLRLLSEAGAELIPFSPLRDTGLPEGVAGVYLPGGYPELYAPQLAGNGAMKESIANAVQNGMPAYAECGGFIYLTGGVADSPEKEEAAHRFVGAFPVVTRMLPRRKALGYREVELVATSILGGTGVTARGHEFHYSEISEMPPEVERLYKVRKGKSDLGAEGYRIKNCLGSYIHLHFGSCPEMAVNFVASCRRFGGASGN
ncbi:cobyrinic acid A,C-diamide synthase [Geobacter sp. OR-1]|uniref:cobyrinate a,c-diamide synthase n=1 Tax=Geobacter sp. OR-1 TaxID=1266765 RepID=UPI000543FB7B|nr:cobyrinate a,c-diamide synthase [Geobacter sp. OR-1]GAM09636.1 cobyrinic acid A,C-diamide synthase [Geobacter sp. OR-1]